MPGRIPPIELDNDENDQEDQDDIDDKAAELRFNLSKPTFFSNYKTTDDIEARKIKIDNNVTKLNGGMTEEQQLEW